MLSAVMLSVVMLNVVVPFLTTPFSLVQYLWARFVFRVLLWATLVGYLITWIYKIMLKRLASHKHSSLFVRSAKYEDKRFYRTNTWACVIKLLTAVMYVFP
jgi:hypothetical protein